MAPYCDKSFSTQHATIGCKRQGMLQAAAAFDGAIMVNFSPCHVIAYVIGHWREFLDFWNFEELFVRFVRHCKRGCRQDVVESPALCATSLSAPMTSIPSTTVPPSKEKKAVLLFWAPWHEASCEGSALDQALGVLSTTLPNVAFFKVEAEECVDLSEKYGVTVVPTVVLINTGGVVAETVQGENVAAVTTAVQRLANMDSGSVPETTSTAPSQEEEASLTDRLNRLIRASEVMLFMKGTPTAPKCGFSRQAVELLDGIQFASFDILTDEEVRQGLKKHSDWPTYPQLYVNGELVGGLDIMKELAQEEGGLREQLGITSDKPETLDDRLKALINRNKVMLFMKGLPSAPKCGFSRQMCELLNHYNVAYDSFNILEDEEVRQGLKKYSDWPTYPQLYINGDLVGGLDICKEMAESGDLQQMLES